MQKWDIPAAMPAACLAVLAACSAAPPAAPERPGSAQAVGAFARLTDPGGCVIEQITTVAHEQYQTQSVSPDGKRLVLAERPEGWDGNEALVHELLLATGAKTDLSGVLTNAGPYSLDGRFIVAAQTTADGKTDVFEYERATGALRAIAPHAQWDWLPSYSPDGRFIAFNSYRVDGQSDIHLFERSTGELTRLTDDPRYEAHAQVSGDGRRILYHRQQGTRAGGGYTFDLLLHDLQTGRETQLTDTEYEDAYPAWAPDSRHIVFSSDRDGEPGKPNLYVLAPDGRILHRLTQGAWKDSYAVWSRDGAYIYFNSDRAGVTKVYRMPMRGFDCVRERAAPGSASSRAEQGSQVAGVK